MTAAAAFCIQVFFCKAAYCIPMILRIQVIAKPSHQIQVALWIWDFESR
jgi:hypothetical protein